MRPSQTWGENKAGNPSRPGSSRLPCAPPDAQPGPITARPPRFETVSMSAYAYQEALSFVLASMANATSGTPMTLENLAAESKMAVERERSLRGNQ